MTAPTATGGWASFARSQVPQPTDIERRVGEGGWLVELLLPRTDAGVLTQTAVILVLFALLLWPARRAALLRLWLAAFAFTAGLLVLRGSH